MNNRSRLGDPIRWRRSDMYAWVWRQIPGPWPVRLLIAVVTFALVVVVLFLWVFPWLEPRLPFVDVTVDDSSSASHVDSTIGPADFSSPRSLDV